MGAWGTGIFANDTADDIRSEYREHLEDRVPDDEATRRVMASFSHLLADDRGELWIALAAAQSQVGRLDDTVKTAALAAIDGGLGLDEWAEAGPTEVARRTAALRKLREQLTGPQPAPKTLRRRRVHREIELAAGDVLRYVTADGRLVLFRVAGVRRARVGDFPLLEWLDWRSNDVPDAATLARLHPLRAPATPGMPERPLIYTVTRFRTIEPDWRACGFDVVTRLPSWPSRDDLPPHFSAGWRALSLTADQNPDPVAGHTLPIRT